MTRIPNSPFSTRLSGSAKETELRIRSIFQWKKQRPPVWLMAAVTALILSCGGLVSCQVQPVDDGSTPPGEEPGDAGYAQAFYQILVQDAPFLDSASGMTWRLSQLDEMIWSDPEVDARAEQFAIADLDADGTPEVVILTNQHIHSEPILILRWQDGQVYCYQDVGRGMQDLKSDGTSEWSDGAYSNGFARDRYQPSEDGGADVCMADMLGEYGALDEEPWYTLNGREVSKEEYEAALDAQRAKPSAVWYELTAENAAAALGVSAPPGEEPGDAGYAQAFYQILTQDAPFLDSASGMTWRLSQLEEMIWSDPEVDVRAERFAVADLDADGTPELVIPTEYPLQTDPILILRWQDGQVYYYQRMGRGMQNLKTDGTSEWSDSGFSNGFGRDRYQPSEDGGADICMADMLGEYGALDEEPWYTLNGREVSREEYEAALDAQRAKPSAVWYDLTAENAAAALGVSAPATR